MKLGLINFLIKTLALCFPFIFYTVAYSQSKIDSKGNVFEKLDNKQAVLLNIEHQLADSMDVWDFESYNHLTERGLKIANELKADTSIAYLYAFRGFYLYQVGEFTQAKKDFLMAIEYYNHIPVELESFRVKYHEANSYQSLGVINDIQGLNHFALKNYLTAIDIYKELLDSINTADCFMNIGIIYANRGDFIQAENHYQKAQDYFEALNDSLGIAILKLNQGVLADDRNDTEGAMLIYKDAMLFSAKINDTYGVALASNNYGSMLVETGQMDSAIKYIDNAFDISIDINDSSLIAEVLYNYGVYYTEIYNNPKAEKALMETFRISSKQKIVELQLEATKKLSELYSRSKKYELAFKYLSIYDSLNTKINTDETKRRFALIDQQYEEDTRKKEAALTALEIKTISDKLKYNQVLSALAISGLLLIIIFIIILFKRYNLEKKIKNQLEKANSDLLVVNLEYQQTLISKKEKDILLKEIHHRVKNNLQIINSLLRFQAQKAPENTQNIFQDLQTRITAMAILHDQLYLTKDFSMIDVKNYLIQLITSLKSVYRSKGPITTELKISIGHLDLDTLHPIGLLINEIVSNSMKYAFEGIKQKEIYLHFEKSKDELTLKIGDNGIGMVKRAMGTNLNSIGLELIDNLSEQLGGKLERRVKKGTHYKLTFQ